MEIPAKHLIKIPTTHFLEHILNISRFRQAKNYSKSKMLYLIKIYVCVSDFEFDTTTSASTFRLYKLHFHSLPMMLLRHNSKHTYVHL